MAADSPDVITIGETMVLVAPKYVESLLDTEEVQLTIGGAESNVAVHLSALGHTTSWVSALGDDALGPRVLRTLDGYGIDTHNVHLDAAAPTGVYFKDPGQGVLYYRAGSAASRMTPESIAPIPIERARVVHVSGITPALSPSCAALIDAVFDRMVSALGIVSFDVNYRAGLWSIAEAAPKLQRLANRADVVFVGRDEAETLWGCVTAADVRTQLPGAGTLVVKDGDIGATEFSREGEVFVPAIPTEVVEAVGAGDAFAAGYLGARLSGASAFDRLQMGHARASLVLRSMGDFC